ncbi:hypothetical protein [Streptomyces sp. NPDC007264]|uniref:hypothetical protein n=1 Tax=Streptomyces sp. NPDC007264 TaxID=3364777 RepID=UPI0036DE40CC
MRRSTVWTRRWGAAALVSAALAALLPLLRYGAPTPRRDLLAALAFALVCGLGWVAATFRAPVIGPPLAKPDGDAFPVPGVLPRTPLAPLGGRLALALAVCALVAAQILAWQPDGPQARTIAALREAGARVATAEVTGITAEEKTDVGVSGGRFNGAYWYASFTAELPDGTALSVDRGIVARPPFEGREVSVLYAPGHAELGGWVDESTDVTAYVHTPRPPSFLGPYLLAVPVTGMALAAAVGFQLTGRGPRRLLAEDAAEGRVYVVEVTALTAMRKEHTTVGSRAGTTKVEVTCSLRAKTGRRRHLDLRVPKSDIPALAAEFGRAGGRLLFARRWRMTDGDKAVPGVFVAPDGRIFHFTASRQEVGLLTPRHDSGLSATDRSTAARDWSGVCRTTPAGRLLIVALYTAAAATALPVLTGTASHLTGYLPLPALALAGALGLALAHRWASSAGHPVWQRLTSTDPRVTA